MVESNAAEWWVLVGTYTHRGNPPEARARGVYVYSMDGASGALSYVSVSPDVEDPSFLALNADYTRVYCVNEQTVRDGEYAGGVTALAFDRSTGSLGLINRQSTRGSSPCHLAVDATERTVLAVNYSSGSVCVLPIKEDGALDPVVTFVQHEGSSVHPKRQEGPHPHSINLDASNRRAYVPDLGLDRVMIYEFDAHTGTLDPAHEQPWVRARSGSGPRHLAFHPTGRTIYVGNELDSTVAVYSVEPRHGTLREVQTVSSLPSGFAGRNSIADIHVHPTGEYVYASNRGHDSIAAFRVESESSTLTAVGHTATRGECPRNFAIDPTGTFLIAANQDSNDLFAFRIDLKSGMLAAVGDRVHAPTPVCVKFVPR
jgi:6-phosphogluconolactonase